MTHKFDSASPDRILGEIDSHGSDDVPKMT